MRAGPPLRSAGRHQHDCFQEFKYSVDGNTENAKRQEEQPNEWVSNEGEECQRPAKEKQEQPEKEFYHGCIYGRNGTLLHCFCETSEDYRVIRVRLRKSEPKKKGRPLLSALA